ncbi:MAG: tetratricopeptide repeat protein [bacterium]
MNRFIISFLSVLVLMVMVAAKCNPPKIESALVALGRQDYTEAERKLQEHLQQDPNNEYAYFLLGEVSRSKGDISKMVEYYDKASALGTEHSKEIYANRLVTWGTKFNDAVNNYYNKGIKMESPDSAKMYFMKAAEMLQTAVLCEPDSAETYNVLSASLMNAGEYEQATAVLEKLNTIRPIASTYVRLGTLYFRKGIESMSTFENSKNLKDSVAAMEYYNKTIAVLEVGKSKFPEEGEIFTILADAYIKANRENEASASLELLVKKDPTNKYYKFTYGVLLLRNGKHEESVAQLQAASDIDPEFKEAVYYLGRAYVNWGVTMREKAEAENKENTDYIEKFKLAVPQLEKSAIFSPEDAELWELLGKVYANLGMEKESINAFEKADKLR